MANQYCILPIARLENIKVDVAGVRTYTKFEVIDIMGDNDLYPALLGIDWGYENYVFIDMKKELVIFEAEGIRVIQPLDPYQEPRFTELIDDRDKPIILDQLYKLTASKREDYINPPAGGFVSWRSIQSSEVGSEVVWDAWKQGGYKIDTRCCAKIGRIKWIGVEVSNYKKSHGIEPVDIFLNKVDREVRDHKVPLLDIALFATPARWWRMHHNTLREWGTIK